MSQATNQETYFQSNYDWRKMYTAQVNIATRQLFNTKNPIPEHITLPVCGKTNATMYETGGSDGDHGSAMIIGDGIGLPTQCKLVFRPKANSIHAGIGVYKGCIIGLAYFQSNQEMHAIYKIESIDLPEQFDTLGSADLTLLAYGRGRDEFTGQSRLRWYSNIENNIINIKSFVSKLDDKVHMARCTTPVYIEQLNTIRNQITIKKKFYEGTLTNGENPNFAEVGLCDMHSSTIIKSGDETHKTLNPETNEVRVNGITDFSDLYNKVLTRASIVYQNENRLVFIVFGHYLAQWNEDGNLTTLYENSTPEEKETAILITDARIVYTQYFGDDEPLILDKYVYRLIHDVDAVDNSKFWDWSNNHSEEFVKMVFGYKTPRILRYSIASNYDELYTHFSSSVYYKSSSDFYFDLKCITKERLEQKEAEATKESIDQNIEDTVTEQEEEQQSAPCIVTNTTTRTSGTLSELTFESSNLEYENSIAGMFTTKNQQCEQVNEDQASTDEVNM